MKAFSSSSFTEAFCKSFRIHVFHGILGAGGLLLIIRSSEDAVSSSGLVSERTWLSFMVSLQQASFSPSSSETSRRFRGLWTGQRPLETEADTGSAELCDPGMWLAFRPPASPVKCPEGIIIGLSREC